MQVPASLQSHVTEQPHLVVLQIVTQVGSVVGSVVFSEGSVKYWGFVLVGFRQIQNDLSSLGLALHLLEVFTCHNLQ